MELRDYVKGDEAKIFELFEASFGRPISKDFWNWRFLQNPLNQTMIKLMWDNDTLAGHYAVSPVSLDMNGAQILTGLSMTTMTHPQYSGRGIFSLLAEALYEEQRSRNKLEAVWGFPNNNSHYAFIKNLRWANIEQIPTFSLRIEKLKKTDPSDVRLADAFNKQNPAAIIDSTSGFDVKVKKTADYLNWRYVQHPTNKYKIFQMTLGGLEYFAVTKIFRSFTDSNRFEVDLIELYFPPVYDALLQLLNAITDFYSQYALLQINMWLPVNDEKHIVLEKIGFVLSGPVTYFGIRVLNEQYKALRENSRWYYSMGDSDIF
ncbi:GNAT family N-acetyltransferase [Taibaiella koreensis]|uniref:GNAT family N-acetyltransferase n=1 Tax=Taibaiella koreensis TaxID=1268548 RepID=UPI000E5A06F4|nr:GNAT family N-acetyltransferase [Taibaiella koreensis]